MEYKRKIVDFTPRAAQLILERYVEMVDFHSFLGGGALKLFEKTFRFSIFIENSFQEREQQKKSLFHELIHIFCLLNSIHASEEAIEAEMERFCEQHPQFCEMLFCRIEDSKREVPSELLSLEERQLGSRQVCKINRRMFRARTTRRQMRLRFTRSLFID